MPFLDIQQKKIYYEFHPAPNAKSTMVFLHEGLGSIPQWKGFPELLCRELHLNCLVYDRYGHGTSDGLQEKRPPDYLLREARDVLPALLIEAGISTPVILFGHSDGATISLMYASLYPEAVTAVVSEAAHVFLEEISLSGIVSTREAFRSTGLKQLLAKYHGEKTEAMFYGWSDTWLDPAMKAWTMEQMMKNIKSPVLAIQGSDDEYGSQAQLESIKAHTGGACEILLIPECGHIPHLQQQQLVVTACMEFFSKHQIV